MANIEAGDGTEKITELGPSLADLDDGTTPGAVEAAPATTQAQSTEENQETPDAETEAEPDKEGTESGTQQEAEVDPLEVTPEAFFSEVNKLHGFDLEVTYPEDVDPLSPEGVHLRDKALIERVIADTHENMKQTDPRGYAYLLHRQAGGDDATFFAQPSSALPEYSTFKESVDLQKQVLSAELTSKGLDKEVVDAVVEKAIADKKLFEKANQAYQAKETAERQALERAAADAESRTKAEQKAIQDTVDAITDVVMNSKLNSIVIPDAKRAEFAEYVKQHLYYDGEQFFITKPVNEKTLADALQTEFFGFVKGNLSELVEKRAKTQVAQTMRLRASKTKDTNKSTAGGAKSGGFVALADL